MKYEDLWWTVFKIISGNHLVYRPTDISTDIPTDRPTDISTLNQHWTSSHIIFVYAIHCVLWQGTCLPFFKSFYLKMDKSTAHPSWMITKYVSSDGRIIKKILLHMIILEPRLLKLSNRECFSTMKIIHHLKLYVNGTRWSSGSNMWWTFFFIF